MSREPTPVTVVSGYLGAGKTTLVNHVLENPGDRRIAVLVNDMGEVNIDAALIESERGEDGVVDLSNGCICCRLQDDLLVEARRLAETRAFDYLLVESSGISEPIPVAQVFTTGTEDSDIDPTEWFRLDTMVSVLDTYGFWKEFDAGASLPDRATDARDHSLAAVFVDQIEFCDVLLLNKTDMVPADVLDRVEAVAARLQPRAERVRTTYAAVDVGRILGTGRFDFETARRSQGWKRALAGDDHGHEDAHDRGEPTGHGHEASASAAETHGVASFVYRADRPFHPGRLADWLDDWDGAVIRAKGVCWILGYDEQVMGLSQAGPSIQVGPIGEWDDARDERRTQLVFIGQSMDEPRLRTELEACLATDVELRSTEAPAARPFPR